MVGTTGQFDLAHSEENIPVFEKAVGNTGKDILRYITFGNIDSAGDIYPSWRPKKSEEHYLALLNDGPIVAWANFDHITTDHMYAKHITTLDSIVQNEVAELLGATLAFYNVLTGNIRIGKYTNSEFPSLESSIKLEEFVCRIGNRENPVRFKNFFGKPLCLKYIPGENPAAEDSFVFPSVLKPPIQIDIGDIVFS